MSELKGIIKHMRPTGSSSKDKSIKSIKMAADKLQPLILHLIDLVIRRADYPTRLKMTKICPIRMEGKDELNAEGWRPINIFLALSKIVEKALLKQILKHLKDEDLIMRSHHGSVQGKSTQTIVTEIHYALLQDLIHDKDSVLLVLDQSKAYNLVDHEILLRKMAAIGFDIRAIQLMKAYLSERKQYVQLQGFDSETLTVGPQSVTHGLTLSCTLYVIYILDMPTLFHGGTRHTPGEQRNCGQDDFKTFVDDNLVKVSNRHIGVEHIYTTHFQSS